jgi:pimeloyl-ACP methyl ester carboxylesterase
MPWTLETVAGHPCEVFRPARRHAQGHAVLYLHGVHETPLADQRQFTEAFERHGLVVIGPRTRRSWWTDRICPEFDRQISAERHVLERVVPWMESEFAVSPPQIGLLGTSMGGQGALRWSYKYPDRFPVVAAISPAIDFHRRMVEPDENDPLLEMYDDPESARQETAILYIHPLNWPRHQFFCCDPGDPRWYESADRLRMKLSSLGVPFLCDLETTVGGHGFAYYNAMADRAIDFLVNGLDSERLRIV